MTRTIGIGAMLAAILLLGAGTYADAASCNSICGQGRGVCKRAAKLVRDAAREQCNEDRDACLTACPTCEDDCATAGDLCRTGCAEAGDPAACIADCDTTQDGCTVGCETCEDDCDDTRRLCRSDAQDGYREANEACKITRTFCRDGCGAADDAQCVARCTRDAGQCLKDTKRDERRCAQTCPTGRERRDCRHDCKDARYTDDATCVSDFALCMQDCIPAE